MGKEKILFLFNENQLILWLTTTGELDGWLVSGRGDVGPCGLRKCPLILAAVVEW